MIHYFNPKEGLILVSVRLVGPAGEGFLTCALDTGATFTVLNTDLIAALGYDPAISPERVQITTGSGVEFCPKINIQTLEAVGKRVAGFPILCHTLPPSIRGDKFAKGF
ncbi:MAG: aspartyl protease family protein [Elusimicrobia bacterium]|nr:aspartyl protease family protein [Elusimicrobiota bacterium]